MLLKVSVMDTARSCGHIFRNHRKVSCMGRYSTMPQDVNFAETESRLNSPSPGSKPNSIYPVRCRTQEFISISHFSIAKRYSNAKPLDAPIDGSLAVIGHSMSFFREVIGLETVPGEVADVNARKRMNFASNSVLGKTLKFLGLSLSPAHTADELNSVFAPATRSGGLTDNSNWLASRHHICISYGGNSERSTDIHRLYYKF